MDILKCEGIRKAFDQVDVLSDINIEFPPTGIAAIIGPNGAGKTTLLNILTGFIRPDAGRCMLGKRATTHLPPHRISQLGVARTFQNLRLIFHISVVDNLLLARPRQRGEKLLGALLRLGVADEEAGNREDAERLLKFVGLADESHVTAEELSYGQQKLLTLACCLATEARILLLDEPTAGVHPEMVSRIIEILGQLRERGKLIVFIEHDLSVVRQIADTVFVMDGGKVIGEGATGEVLERPEIMEAYLA